MAPKKIDYQSLNQLLQFPINPAYQHKKVKTDDTIKAQLLKEAQDNKKNQTFLEWCQEQSIAFTDTDKIMYKMQSSSDLHYILLKFLNQKTKVQTIFDDNKPQD